MGGESISPLVQIVATYTVGTGALFGIAYGGIRGIMSYKEYKIKNAIDNGEPPFKDGQLYFPFMRDYVTYMKRYG